MEPAPELVEYWNKQPDGNELRAKYFSWSDVHQHCFNKAVIYIVNATPDELKEAILYLETLRTIP